MPTVNGPTMVRPVRNSDRHRGPRKPGCRCGRRLHPPNPDAGVECEIADRDVPHLPQITRTNGPVTIDTQFTKFQSRKTAWTPERKCAIGRQVAPRSAASHSDPQHVVAEWHRNADSHFARSQSRSPPSPLSLRVYSSAIASPRVGLNAGVAAVIFGGEPHAASTGLVSGMSAEPISTSTLRDHRHTRPRLRVVPHVHAKLEHAGSILEGVASHAFVFGNTSSMDRENSTRGSTKYRCAASSG